MTVRPARRRQPGLLQAGILWLVRSNVFVALAATSVAVSTTLLTGLPLDPVALFIVFAVTIFVYSFNRLTDRAEDAHNTPGRAAFVSRYGRPLFALGAALYAVAFTIAVLIGHRGVPALAVPLAVAVVYSVGGLKRVLVVKNLIVGVSWGLIPLGVGVYHGVGWSVELLVLTGFVTAMVTVAAVVFDIKDVAGDRAQGIRTVPIVVGVGRTRLLAAGTSIVVGTVVTALLLVGVLPSRYTVLLGVVAYVAGYSLVARRDRTGLFYGFIADGEHVALAVTLLLGETLL